MARDVGVVHGRFHPPHEGHVEYMLKAKERCDHLFVGLTNPTSDMTAHDPADPERSSKAANPFEYFERQEMVRRAMEDHDVPFKKFRVVPFPINEPDKLQRFAPNDATYFLELYEEWDRKKKGILESLGLSVEVLHDGDPSTKWISATQVRRAIAEGEDWRRHVSESVAEYIIENSLDDRVRKYQQKEGEF